MKISALRLFNVKRFADRGVAIEGIGDGVNVLCAPNEFGKSTSFEALHVLFFQPHSSTAGEIRAIRPYSGGNPLIEADVVTETGRYRITKQFYGGRFARIVELDTGRILAQADEAENFIAGFVEGGAGGPAGLLWVRQGMTGLERRSRADEESDKQIRTSLLESVQGEVEAVTGGRRMAEIMVATSEARDSLITPTGRAKSGGRYAIAIEDRDRLGAEEQKLSTEVAALRDEFDRRASTLRRLAELEVPDEREARRLAVEIAQKAFDTARVQSDKLKAVQAELSLARERFDTAADAGKQFRENMERARALHGQEQMASRRREEAVGRRQAISEAIEKTHAEAETAEIDETVARDLSARLDAAAKAREASKRLVGLKDRLNQAETVRREIEKNEAEVALLTIPSGAIDELADLDVEIARIRTLRDAGRPHVMVVYEEGVTERLVMDGEPLGDGEERGYDRRAQLVARGVGTITLRSNQLEDGDDRLEQVETKRQTLLTSMGVSNLAAARAQQEQARRFEANAREGQAQMVLLAPDGLAKLREEIAACTLIGTEQIEIEADPIETRTMLDDAGQRRTQARLALRELDAGRASADDALVQAEADLARIQAEVEQIGIFLGPEDKREQCAQQLTDRLVPLKDKLSGAEVEARALADAAIDMDSAEATLSRARSVEQAADKEIGQLRETLASLNGQIRTRSEDAIEEKWQETREALAGAKSRVVAFEREIAILQRLAGALDAARSQARELYLKPVMVELKPLLALLFDDVSITFDEKTLLPEKIMRNGLEEEVDRLSGGMREQLSVLTRLAFARLLARDGRPAPVILDDALVYSDDDRIEKMFDALHRQSRDQQIIVFSCRQRAFQRLGGNILQMTDWRP
jgi:hypothetical protein